MNPIFILCFALLFPLISSLTYFSELPYIQVFYAGGKIIQFSFPLIVLLSTQGQLPRLSRPPLKATILGLGSGLVLGACIALSYWLLKDIMNLDLIRNALSQRIQVFGLNTFIRFFYFSLFLSLIHSFFEEFYWRFFTYQKLKDYVSPLAANLISSLGFSAHHWIVIRSFAPGTTLLPLVFILTLCVALAGAYWAKLYEDEKTLFAPWVSHALTDAAILVVGFQLLEIPT